MEDYEILLSQRELSYTLASMIEVGIFDFHIEEIPEEDRIALKVKFKNMKYFLVSYKATKYQEDNWSIKSIRGNYIF